ncbi:uncharacterized protein LODBEIA_P26970 [Lodderomyces beijingensis]|uniref:Uncharacterized protein n=1 Tax=Lodderomyces beijingensis TaxID=1775926 RepID=A0ABP0ZJZ6_9ASCO
MTATYTQTNTTTASDLEKLVDEAWKRTFKNNEVELLAISRIHTIIDQIQHILHIEHLFTPAEASLIDRYVNERPTTKLSKRELAAFLAKSIIGDGDGGDGDDVVRERFRLSRGELKSRVAGDVRDGYDYTWRLSGHETSEGKNVDVSGEIRGIHDGADGDGIGRSARLPDVGSSVSSSCLRTAKCASSGERHAALDSLELKCRSYQRDCIVLQDRIRDIQLDLRKMEQTVAEQAELIQVLKRKEKDVSLNFTKVTANCINGLLAWLFVFSYTGGFAKLNSQRVKDVYLRWSRKLTMRLVLASVVVSVCLVVILVCLVMVPLNSSGNGYVYESHDSFFDFWRYIPFSAQRFFLHTDRW